MIRRMFFAATMLGFMFGMWAPTASAQDILGLSLRPTDAMTGSPGRGSVDILRSNGAGKYTVRVDMSAAADGMNLDDFENATDWVVWAVDMDGVRHNLGTLDGELMLESVPVDYMVARVYVTAESDAGARSPGDPLFSVTLRQVEEVDTPPADEDSDEADEDAAEEDADEDASEEDASEEDEKPEELPTTGGPLTDMLMLLAVACALVFGGLKLRAVRIA